MRPTLAQYLLAVALYHEIQQDAKRRPVIKENNLKTDLMIISFIELILSKSIYLDEDNYVKPSKELYVKENLKIYQVWLYDLIDTAMPKTLKEWVELYYSQPSEQKINMLCNKIYESLMLDNILYTKKKETILSGLYMDVPKKIYFIDHRVIQDLQACCDRFLGTHSIVYSETSPHQQDQDKIMYFSLYKNGFLKNLLSENQLSYGRQLLDNYKLNDPSLSFMLMIQLHNDLHILFDAKILK